MKKKFIAIITVLLLVSAMLLSACTPQAATQPTEPPAQNGAAGGGNNDGGGNADSTPTHDGDPNNDDLIGPGIGPDHGLGPIGHDIDTLIARMGPDVVGNLRIGVSVFSLANDWLVSFADEVRVLGDRHGFDVIVLSAENDPVQQANDLRSFQSQQVDGIVAFLGNHDAVSTTITELHYAGTPLVSVTEVGPDTSIAAYLNVSERGRGVFIADRVAEGATAAGRDAYVLMLGLAIELPNLLAREEGFIESAEAHPNVHVVELRRSDTMDGLLNVGVESLIVHDEINTIFGPFFGAMVSGVSAADQVGRDALVYGVDADEPTLLMVSEGRIAGIMVPWPRIASSLTTFTLLRYINGDTFGTEVMEPDNYAMAFATSDNWQIFMDGLYPGR
jgi:ABC-type sugar transport system substrate-binding protein